MAESIKAVCVVVLIAGAMTSGIAWTEERPTEMAWLCRIGGATAAILSLVVFLYIHFRKDVARDYLREDFGDYFNRSGLGFVCVWTVDNGLAYLNVYFQNQYSGPCTAEIALRPKSGLFSRRSELELIEIYVASGPGTFGVTRLPVAIPQSMQRSSFQFEVGASVTYLEGRGKQLRFYEGKTLRCNKSFQNPVGNLLSVAGLLGGMLVWRNRPYIEFQLPGNVATELHEEQGEQTRILWELGDPPLE